MCGTSAARGDSGEKSYLTFFETAESVTTTEPCLKIGMTVGSSVICVKWQSKTNQIFCRCEKHKL